MGASLAVTRALLVYRFPPRPSVALMKCQDYTYIQKKKYSQFVVGVNNVVVRTYLLQNLYKIFTYIYYTRLKFNLYFAESLI